MKRFQSILCASLLTLAIILAWQLRSATSPVSLATSPVSLATSPVNPVTSPGRTGDISGQSWRHLRTHLAVVGSVTQRLS